MPGAPYDLLEEAKDIIDEITDLDAPLQTLDELAEYLKAVRNICETLADEPLQPQPAPTQP
jgi:hypothetical protein